MATATKSAKLANEPRRWRWTVAQYYQLAEAGWFEGRRVELIEGEILEMPPIGDAHVASSINAPEVLRVVFGDGFLLSVQNPLRIPPSSAPQPDIVVVRGSRPLRVAVTPANAVLVVEIADSTLRDDLTTKAQLYATAGIDEYWVIDLVNSELVVHREPREGVYSQIMRLKKGQSIAPLHATHGAVVVDDVML